MYNYNSYVMLTDIYNTLCHNCYLAQCFFISRCVIFTNYMRYFCFNAVSIHILFVKFMHIINITEIRMNQENIYFLMAFLSHFFCIYSHIIEEMNTGVAGSLGSSKYVDAIFSQVFSLLCNSLAI